MSTQNSVKRSLKTRSLWTKFGTRSITATGAVTMTAFPACILNSTWKSLAVQYHLTSYLQSCFSLTCRGFYPFGNHSKFPNLDWLFVTLPYADKFYLCSSTCLAFLVQPQNRLKVQPLYLHHLQYAYGGR